MYRSAEVAIMAPEDTLRVYLGGGDSAIPIIAFGPSSEDFRIALNNRTMTPVQQSAWLRNLAAQVEDLAEQVDLRAGTAPQAESRREPIEQTHGDWTIRILDDQPIAEGKEFAAEQRVVLLRGVEVVREFTYPAYRIWTLLAHWTDDLPDDDGAAAGERLANQHIAEAKAAAGIALATTDSEYGVRS